MGKVLGLAFLVPLFTLGCGDDTGTNPGDAPMVDAPRLPDAAVDRPAIDAPSVDADNTTMTTPNAVVCGIGGGANCDTTSHYCCVVFGGGIPTFDCTADSIDAGTNCSAVQACDGTEDCASGHVCCGTAAGGIGGVSTCQTSCASGDTQLCHNHTQCPSATPLCCTATVQGFQLPFGGCFATDPGNGALCDGP